MPDWNARVFRESKTLKMMISIYCYGRHRNGRLCPECAELTEYALERLVECPFQNGKTICAKCPVHCYKPLMREKIRAIMRYAGPRMSYRHSILAIRHIIDGQRKEPIRPGGKDK